MLDWHKMNIETIIGGKTADNVSYLKLFLIDYKNEFHVENVNASCQKCLIGYHSEFIKKYRTMENTSKYKLLPKREGLQLEFGSSIFVSNRNLTDEYAEILIARFKAVKADFKLSDLFEIYPEPTKKEIVTEEVKEESSEIPVNETTSKRKKRK